MEDIKEDKKGQIIINTGEGKGKTTAALGLALRAAGHGYKVLILQFIKDAWITGESKIIKKLEPEIKMEHLGRGFIKFIDGKMHVTKNDLENAELSLKYAGKKINSGEYDMIILDEINNMISYGLVGVEDVIDIVKNKPRNLDLVLTGRGAPEELIEIADTVSEIREIKHAYSKGIKSRKGIEY